MCENKREEDQAIRSFQEQFLLQQQQSQGGDFFGHRTGGASILPEISPIMLPTWQVNSFHQTHFAGAHHDPFTNFPPPPSNYCGLFGRRPPGGGLQFAYDGTSSDHLRILSETLGPVVGPGSGKMTAQEIMDAKALAASKSHSEAERRRRERINNHLAKLRSLLPSTTKTDKASLLAEVIQHVKELKRQTSLIAENTPIPTETDELTVDAADEDGKFVIKASLCCEDRSDLLPDLIKTLKALRLKTLKAEITTLGGRVKNVLFVTGDEQEDHNGGNDDGGQSQMAPQYCISSIQEALKAVMEKSSGDDTSANAKRQRTTNISTVIDHRSL